MAGQHWKSSPAATLAHYVRRAWLRVNMERPTIIGDEGRVML
ncbi:hypothetical protein VRRI112168_08055 [Vreelandella rituensis]